jgi:NAD-dependent deacetylase
MGSFEERSDRATGLLRNTNNVAAFTGAGISTESGISDFRSPGGVWERYRMVTYQEFLARRESRKGYWRMKHELFKELRAARPNAAHIALADMETLGKLTCLITQNIDGLHQLAGNSPERVIELHGTNREAICLECGKRWPIEEIDGRLESLDFEPVCDVCNGLVKPATVSFGQAMPEEEMVRAFRCAQKCDLLFMIGSSLQVEPAASVPRVAHESGASLIYINRTVTPTDHLATVIFHENAGEVMESIISRLHSR